jgi:hypothetical protein
MNKPKILAASWHPGSARAVANVVRKLQLDNLVDVLTVGHGPAEDVFRQKGISSYHIGNFPYALRDVILASMEELVREQKPALVLTGFSPQDPKHRDVLEQNLTLAARGQNIPSVGVLEYWMPGAYAQLVSDLNASNKILDAGYLRYAPDFCAISDDIAWAAMVKEGFNADALMITGSPVWDDLVNYRDTFTAEDRKRIRADLQIPDDAYLLLFMSQPVELQFGNAKGYTEKTVLDDLVRGFAAVPQDKKPFLLVKSHPCETDTDDKRAAFAARVQNLAAASGAPNVGSFTGKYDPLKLIASSDAFASMITTSFIDAVALGKPAFSLQPGIAEEDTVVTNTLGLTVPVYLPGEIGGQLRRLLTDDRYAHELSGRRAKFNGIDGRASERVTHLLYQVLSIPYQAATPSAE